MRGREIERGKEDIERKTVCGFLFVFSANKTKQIRSSSLENSQVRRKSRNQVYVWKPR